MTGLGTLPINKKADNFSAFLPPLLIFLQLIFQKAHKIHRNLRPALLVNLTHTLG